MLAVCVVYQHHGELQLARCVHGLQAQDTGGGFLAAANNIGDKLREFVMQGGYQVSPVVNDNVGAHLQHTADVFEILFFVAAVDGEDIKAFVHQGGRYVVLGAQRVGTRDEHFRSAGGQHLTQVSRLGLQMHAQGHFQAFEGLRFFEVFLDAVQKRHVRAYPAQFELSAFPQIDIFDVTFHKSANLRKKYLSLRKTKLKH